MKIFKNQIIYSKEISKNLYEQNELEEVEINGLKSNIWKYFRKLKYKISEKLIFGIVICHKCKKFFQIKI